MTVRSVLHTLSTAAELIATGGSASSMVHVLVANPSATIFVGGADVDTTDGLEIPVDGSVSIPLGPSDSLYAIASSGAPTVTVLTTRTGVIED